MYSYKGKRLKVVYVKIIFTGMLIFHFADRENWMKSDLHLSSKSPKLLKCCQKWKVLYIMIDDPPSVSPPVASCQPPLCILFQAETLCRYGPQNKTDMLHESYGGSWRRAGKIWMISNYKDTDISIWVMETFMVLVSGWLGCPVWVALERQRVRLQTISIPLDPDCKTGWQRTSALCLYRTGERSMCVEQNHRDTDWQM